MKSDRPRHTFVKTANLKSGKTPASRVGKSKSREIKKLYDSGDRRLTQERNDFLLPQILDFVQTKKWMNLRPEYQRRLVWDKKKKSLFIESLLMNIPVPPIFLFEFDYNRYEVMDGQQRLNAVVEFYNDKFPLAGLESWSELNGLTYSQCPDTIQRGLDRRKIAANILLAESAGSADAAKELRRTVFERLNTGGQQLNAQELRNSLYSGPLNEMLIRLAGYRLFNEIWQMPIYDQNYKRETGYISPKLAENKLFKRMTDCEIVLRFFAFREPENIKGSVRSILDNYMERNMQPTEEKLARFESRFKQAVDTSFAIFGDKTFQIIDEAEEWKLSQPLFDAVTVAVDALSDLKDRLIDRREIILERLTTLMKKKSNYDILVGRANTAESIKRRIKLVRRVMEECAA
jgi:hypothetical protein